LNKNFKSASAFNVAMLDLITATIADFDRIDARLNKRKWAAIDVDAADTDANANVERLDTVLVLLCSQLKLDQLPKLRDYFKEDPIGIYTLFSCLLCNYKMF
jgi:hypothetical protein